MGCAGKGDAVCQRGWWSDEMSLCPRTADGDSGSQSLLFCLCVGEQQLRMTSEVQSDLSGTGVFKESGPHLPALPVKVRQDEAGLLIAGRLARKGKHGFQLHECF